MEFEIIDKAALRGEPSYVWRAGQQRRLEMILDAAGPDRMAGEILDNGCGIGIYIQHMLPYKGHIMGMEFDFGRAVDAKKVSKNITSAAGESLPYPSGSFDLILSHEVIEHVENDLEAVREMVRVLSQNGRMVIFCPNRGYPFETHGIYWRGKYRFGNIPFVNYLPTKLRNKFAPHVKVYRSKDLERLIQDLPVNIVQRTIIFGAYDNIIARWPLSGKLFRSILYWIEKTPLRVFGLSHFWVVEKREAISE